VRVGLIGVTTIDALRATLPVNVHGLRVAPLAATIVSEGRTLRDAGAEVVVVIAHAGGSCWTFGDPRDLASCDESSEIFQVANALPAGLVDVIAAGHTHDGVAHIVNGVAIVQAYALGRSFARVDLSIDRGSRAVTDIRPFAPRELCASQDPETFRCDAFGRQVAQYEGKPVTPDPRIDAAMASELRHVAELRAAPLGVIVESTVRRSGETEWALGNLFADALRQGTPGADIGINNNARGGLRADLPPGPLTFGGLYDVFPFDNRLVTLTMSGDELRRFFADEILRNRRGALGVSGVRVRASCGNDQMQVDLYRPSGQRIEPDDRLVVATMDTLAAGVAFIAVPSAKTMVVPETAPILREVVEEWIRRHGGRIAPGEFVDVHQPRWEWPATSASSCLSQ
jgi:5'-nucleotidase